jgi:hypothetical protein
MRITESQLRRIVREEVDGMKGAAPPRSPLGKWAFADQRDSVPPEPNTKKEQALYNAIIKHFMDNPLLPRDECDLIQGFMKKGLYSDVFMEPQVPTVYRGINVTLEVASSIGLLKWYENSPVNLLAYNSKTRIINPQSGQWSSSWSTARLGSRDDTESVVWNYAAGNTAYGRKGPIGIVYCADVAANPLKFIDCEPLYELKGVPTVEDEVEAIGMGPIEIKKMYFWKLE